MTTRRTGLREQKKQATRVALREAALRLALERGPDNVRVDDIAEAAGVSPRTYNNYFSSREQAIVAAVTAERESRVAAAVAARPAHVRLADALTEAVLEQYTEPRDHDKLLLITTSPTLCDAFLDATTAIEHPLAAVIDQRLGGAGTLTARVLAAGVAAAVRAALQQWLRPPAAPPATGGLVVPSGSLPDLLRSALAALAPAFDAAEEQAQQRSHQGVRSPDGSDPAG
ncbi:TetR family transcriptional regulator [Streptomyces sp. F-3]|uniref:TetR/AcrR family transcriptional regulator n=1 Tax=Streptomyces thermogriseus TaxID=75292 RepID=A0ABP4DI09_9ACTN|nr:MULTISPECIES: TetR/AcrR family transcriptional regulator [Streptomyces]MDN5382537.1 TetR/AcrR family transcriptional regulator [Streptomyces sp. LB8]GAT81947.1 TetR family transcriptional regulator [Streptomyces sp. F-3]